MKDELMIVNELNSVTYPNSLYRGEKKKKKKKAKPLTDSPR